MCWIEQACVWDGSAGMWLCKAVGIALLVWVRVWSGLTAHGSQLMAHGSLTAHGSRSTHGSLTAHGSHGSWVMANCSWLTAHGSRLMAHGSFIARGSWLHGSRLMAECGWVMSWSTG